MATLGVMAVAFLDYFTLRHWTRRLWPVTTKAEREAVAARGREWRC